MLSLSIAIGAVQAFSLGRGLARYLERIGVHRLSLRRLGRLRLRLFDVVVPLVPGAVGGRGSAALLSGFVSSTEAVAEGYARSTTAAVDVSASILLGSTVAALCHPVAGVVLLAAALATVAVAAILARWGRSTEEAAAAQRTDLAAAVIAAVRSAPELVAYGRQDLVEQALDQVRRRSAALSRRRALAAGVARSVTTLVAGAAVAAVVGTGLAATDSHRLSGVMLAVVSFAALSVLDQCANLPAVFAGSNVARAASARLADLERLAAPVHEPSVDLSAAAGAPPPSWWRRKRRAPAGTGS